MNKKKNDPIKGVPKSVPQEHTRETVYDGGHDDLILTNSNKNGGHIIRIKNAVLLTLALGLSAACATPYEPRTESGMSGYYEYREAGNTYMITYLATCYTDEKVVDGYLLRRAGEVCAAAGYTDYDVLDRSFSKKVGYRPLPGWYYAGPFATPGSWNVLAEAYTCDHIEGMVHIECTAESK